MHGMRMRHTARQVCNDYEDGTLWYNEKDYKQWL